jgi:hypothetical protein
MSDETSMKQEWVFDGTRGEFWGFMALAVFALLFFVSDAYEIFWGKRSPVHTDFLKWIPLLVLPILAVQVFRVHKLFTLAVGLESVGLAMELAISHSILSPAFIVLLLPMNALAWLAALLGSVLYVKERLRLESVPLQADSQTQNP